MIRLIYVVQGTSWNTDCGTELHSDARPQMWSPSQQHDMGASLTRCTLHGRTLSRMGCHMRLALAVVTMFVLQQIAAVSPGEILVEVRTFSQRIVSSMTALYESVSILEARLDVAAAVMGELQSRVAALSTPCREGWRLDGQENCVDFDECSRSPCPAYETCINTNGSFFCQAVTTCKDYYISGSLSSGSYTLQYNGSNHVHYCQMTLAGGGWTLYLVNGAGQQYKSDLRYGQHPNGMGTLNTLSTTGAHKLSEEAFSMLRFTEVLAVVGDSQGGSLRWALVKSTNSTPFTAEDVYAVHTSDSIDLFLDDGTPGTRPNSRSIPYGPFFIDPFGHVDTWMWSDDPNTGGASDQRKGSLHSGLGASFCWQWFGR